MTRRQNHFIPFIPWLHWLRFVKHEFVKSWESVAVEAEDRNGWPEEPDRLKRLTRTVSIEIPEAEFEFLKIIYGSIPIYGGSMSFSDFLYVCANDYLYKRVREEAPNVLQARIMMIQLGKNPYASYQELRKETGWKGPGRHRGRLFQNPRVLDEWQGYPIGRGVLAFRKFRSRWEFKNPAR